MEEYASAPEQSVFLAITPEETSLVFYLLGLVISESLTINELNLLANGLFETSQVMFVIAAQRTLANEVLKAQTAQKEGAKTQAQTAEKMEAEIRKLQDQIAEMRKDIDRIKHDD